MSFKNWSASGSKESKQKLLSKLIVNNIKPFEGRKTARRILKDGEDIKSIDRNRKGKRGDFFLSCNKIDYKNTMNFNLDNVCLDWVMQFILK